MASPRQAGAFAWPQSANPNRRLLVTRGMTVSTWPSIPARGGRCIGDQGDRPVLTTAADNGAMRPTQPHYRAKLTSNSTRNRLTAVNNRPRTDPVPTTLHSPHDEQASGTDPPGGSRFRPSWMAPCPFHKEAADAGSPRNRLTAVNDRRAPSRLAARFIRCAIQQDDRD